MKIREGQEKHRFIFIDIDAANPLLVNVTADKDLNVSVAEGFAYKLEELV